MMFLLRFDCGEFDRENKSTSFRLNNKKHLSREKVLN